MPAETEIKFVIDDLERIRKVLQSLNFHEKTARTHEMNTLFDKNGELFGRGEILRLREYGKTWVLTHKGKSNAGKHKSRAETETEVKNGGETEGILRALGYEPSFRYEKFRSEWEDGSGYVVLDETPIGNFGEIEGNADWIDNIAEKLSISEDKYINKSYGELFRNWKKESGSAASNMTFDEVKQQAAQK